MPPFRNPFNRRNPAVNDENAPPSTNGQMSPRLSLASSRTSSAISIGKPTKEPDEFKMSVVNDSGVYLPPSPPEKRGFWQRTPTSTTTSSHRSALSDNEPFSISRESFESYRRPFDISARSPVIHADSVFGRQSLDSKGPRTPRSALSGKFDRAEPLVVDEEEVFEDVGLEDDSATKQQQQQQQQQQPPLKKHGLFSRFTDSKDAVSPSNPSDENSRPSSSHRGFHLPGRKRGQSGQGAELGNIPKPMASKEIDVVGGR